VTVKRRHFFTRGVLLLILATVVVYGALLLWVGANAERDSSVPSDAAIVLGAHAFYNGAWNPCLVSRVRQGVLLLKRGTVKYLILSGGVDKEDGASEAESMRQIALKYGAKPNQLLLEGKATSTAENVEFSRAILQREGLRSVVIVSDPYHLPRAGLIAKKKNLTFTLSPALNSPCWTRWRYLGSFFLREPIAIFENALRGSL
jgi:uncharacterized SAM-binding protein YcdF (DUF218 family)